MLPHDSEPVFTVRDGVRLAHFAYGTPCSGRPPIVLIHGWTGDQGIFAPQIDRFSKTGHVIAVNLRGHGESDAPEMDYTIACFADDVASQCREAGLAKPVVIGSSMGGVIALELCGRNPDLASGLVMIDSMIMIPAALRKHPGIRQYLTAIGGPNYLQTMKKNAWDLGGDFDSPERRTSIFETYVVPPCERTPQHVASSSMRHLLLEYDPLPAATACKIPMAYISAAAPTVEMARDLRRLKEVCPQLVTARTLLAGHFNTIEVSDQVNAMLDRFLAVGIKPTNRR